jgi:hypothetical protein
LLQISGIMQKKPNIVRNLRNKKKWIEDYDKAVTMTDELELAL